MAKLIDPDDLVVASAVGQLGIDGNIWLDTTAKTIDFADFGVLVAKDGVTGNAIWAKLVDLWTTAAYQPYPFPMNVLDAKSGQYIFGQDPGGTFNGWVIADAAAKQYVRDAGWKEYLANGTLNAEYVGIVSLGGVSLGSQLYYQKEAGGAAINFTYDDAVNEGIKVDDTAQTYFKGFVREYNKKYTDSVLADTGQSATGAYIVNLLLSNEDDLDITDTDANVSTISPYTEINIKYFDQAYSKDVESTTARDFGIVIDVGTWSGVDGSAPGGASVLTTAEGGMTASQYDGGVLTIWEGTDKNTQFPIVSNTATTITVTGTIAAGTDLSFSAQRATPVNASLKQIYTKVQYELRQDADINEIAGVITGKTADLLLNFVGPTLNAGFFTPANSNGGGTGVMIEGIAAADINDVVLYDNTAVTREYPYASAGALNFNLALSSGATGYFRMYFTNDDAGDNLGNDYGTSGAITVNDASGSPIQGTITSGVINFTYDFTGNVQRGAASAGEIAPITVVAGNAGSAKPVVATGSITQSKAISVTLTAETDRAYLV